MAAFVLYSILDSERGVAALKMVRNDLWYNFPTKNGGYNPCNPSLNPPMVCRDVAVCLYVFPASYSRIDRAI